MADEYPRLLADRDVVVVRDGQPERTRLRGWLDGHDGPAPAYRIELVADAIAANQFWVFPHPRFVQLAFDRWQRIAEGYNPQPTENVPGMPPTGQIAAEIRRLLAGPGGALRLRLSVPLARRRSSARFRQAAPPEILR